MKPETAQFVEFARDMFRRAGQMSSIHLNGDAGRAAYLACFHVAQAIIFEREGRVLKTHRGVQTEFNKIMQDDPRANGEFVGFLARAYKFKTAADHGFDALTHPTDDDARNAMRDATRVVDAFISLLNPSTACPIAALAYAPESR